MKKLTSVLVSLFFASTLAWAVVYAHSPGGQGWGMHGGGMMDPENLSDDHLDRLGEAIAERFQSMQAIASEQDADARRELVREHFNTMHQNRWGKRDDAGKQGQSQGRMMGPGMMGPGMMGPGMMGPGMMGPGMMGPGMMHYGQMNDEHLDLMGEHMAEQHARMARIAKTTDKAERRELLREHFEAMRELMEEMHGQ